MLFLSFRIYENRFVAAAVNIFGERYGFFWRALKINNTFEVSQRITFHPPT